MSLTLVLNRNKGIKEYGERKKKKKKSVLPLLQGKWSSQLILVGVLKWLLRLCLCLKNHRCFDF